jgi:hypothetical protein
LFNTNRYGPFTLFLKDTASLAFVFEEQRSVESYSIVNCAQTLVLYARRRINKTEMPKAEGTLLPLV